MTQNHPLDFLKSLFSLPTYLVLELPSAVAADVIALRARFDGKMACLPAEITIAGSSGVGVLEENQEAEAAFNAMRVAAAGHLHSPRRSPHWSDFRTRRSTG